MIFRSREVMVVGVCTLVVLRRRISVFICSCVRFVDFYQRRVKRDDFLKKFLPAR